MDFITRSKQIFNDYSDRIFLSLLVLIFALLLYKNPFSERTLIPNLEPFPDTIHYLSPALSLIKGKGFFIEREGRIIKPVVPPLYSLSLVPFYLIKSDVRLFYFTNIVLAFLSLWLFYKLTKILFKSEFIQYFLIFLYISNYFIYWVPTLAMAENLLLLIYLAVVYLLFSKITRVNLFLAGILSALLYLTKYASVPLVGSSLLLYFIKISVETGGIRKKFLYWISVLFIFAGILVFFGIYEYMLKKTLIIAPLFTIFSTFIPSSTSQVAGNKQVTNSWTSFSYVQNNLIIYWNALIGGSMRFLWDSTPIVPKTVGILGIVGFISGLFLKRKIFYSLTFLLLIFSQIIFLSTFYTNDGRYIYHAIPSLILGFGMFLNIIYEKFKKREFRIIFYILLFLLLVNYLFLNTIRFKKQIMLNLKYAETPWYYISVKTVNEYFNQNPFDKGGKKPIVISALPPYYVDFFSNGKYTLLPLSRNQEFPSYRYEAWGDYDYSDLLKLYAQKIREGYPLYVSKYGLGNEAYLHRDYDNILKTFKHTEVKKGCYDACDIHKLELKEEN